MLPFGWNFPTISHACRNSRLDRIASTLDCLSLVLAEGSNFGKSRAG